MNDFDRCANCGHERWEHRQRFGVFVKKSRCMHWFNLKGRCECFAFVEPVTEKEGR